MKFNLHWAPAACYIIKHFLASFCKKALLQTLESIDGAAELSVDRSFVAKDFVQSLAVRNSMSSNGSLLHIDPSPLTQFFEKSDSVCHRIHRRNPGAHFQA
jgi:hypothetical protein